VLDDVAWLEQDPLRDLPPFRHDEGATTRETRLEVTALSMKSRDPFGIDLSDIDIKVRAGEIVGIAGVSGNGQKEFLAALSGETIVPSPKPSLDTAHAMRLRCSGVDGIGASHASTPVPPRTHALTGLGAA